MRLLHLTCLILFVGSVFGIQDIPLPSKPNQLHGGESIQILAHRGAPEYVPEHTIGSYSLAMRQMVDYVEPDICLTKDNIPICMHDFELSQTTNVADHPEFADRHRTVVLPSGNTFSGWFTDDFTLSEIKTLRTKQRLPNRDKFYDGLFQVPTLDEAIQFVQKMNQELNLNVGVYIEPKHPAYFESKGLLYDDALIKVLEDNNLNMHLQKGPLAKIIIECFESTQLIRLRNRMDFTFVQLINVPRLKADDTSIEYVEMMSEKGLRNVATYANAIGPIKNYYYTQDLVFKNMTNPDTLTGLAAVNMAHELNMVIHPWTARNHWEDANLAAFFGGSEEAEYRYLFRLGIDGIFSESAGAALAARAEYVQAWSQVTPTPTSEEHHNKDKTTVTALVACMIAIMSILIGIAVGRYLVPHHPPKPSYDSLGLVN